MKREDAFVYIIRFAGLEKVAKLCANFKSGIETVFVNKENQPETIEIDDLTRQADYKYTYSDRSNSSFKSEQADLLVHAVEKFRQAGLELNLPEIFIWYFEQKGVDNVERFLTNNNTNTMPTLPIPLLQAMAQNLQNGNIQTEESAQNNEQNRKSNLI